MDTDPGFKTALEEARKGRDEGGVPIGASLIDADGEVIGSGHNMRQQRSSNTLHVCSTLEQNNVVSSVMIFLSPSVSLY